MSTVKVYDDQTALADAAAWVVERAAIQAVKERKRFMWALSGGSTPKMLFDRLVSDEFNTQIDWSATHIFWGDERTVSPDHTDSNYRMAKEHLLDQVPIHEENIHRIKGELTPTLAAESYNGMLREVFASDGGTPRFDQILLGMGDDGHTASLFPGTAAIQEQKAWVTANEVPQLDTWRITFTPTLINAARQVVFLVSGEGKAERLKQVLYGPYVPDRLPSQIVRPRDGRLLWMIDSAASG